MLLQHVTDSVILACHSGNSYLSAAANIAAREIVKRKAAVGGILLQDVQAIRQNLDSR